jgi:hypothetical protein
MDSDRPGPLLEVNPGAPRTQPQSQSKPMPERPHMPGSYRTVHENTRLAASAVAGLRWNGHRGGLRHEFRRGGTEIGRSAAAGGHLLLCFHFVRSAVLAFGEAPGWLIVLRSELASV